MNIGIVIAIV